MAQRRKRAGSALRDRIRRAVRDGRLQEIERLVADDSRSLRHLVAMTHQPDEEVRKVACLGVGLAARYHPELVRETVQRLVWAMDTGSGGNALTAPEVLQAIARQRPELLLPVVPDLVRLSGDDGLHDGIADALCIVVHNCPGKVGNIMSKRLAERIERGECCDPRAR